MVILFYVGPMFAGKTKSMLAHVRSQRDKKILFAKPLRDTRSKMITTHDGDSQEAIEDNSLVDIVQCGLYGGVQMIGVDEGQFFDDLVGGIKFAIDNDITLVVAALSNTWDMHPFPTVAEALALADGFLHVRATCKCGKPAPFTRRKFDSYKLIICGDKEYEATCRSCHSIPESNSLYLSSNKMVQNLEEKK